MLLKTKKFAKIRVRKLFDINNSFFIFFNCYDFELKFFRKHFGFGNVVHISYLKNFNLKDKIEIFGGENYVCFFDKNNFFDNYFFFKQFNYKLNYVCYNYCFFNDLTYFFLSYSHLYVINVIFFIIFFDVISLFFFSLNFFFINCLKLKS